MIAILAIQESVLQSTRSNFYVFQVLYIAVSLAALAVISQMPIDNERCFWSRNSFNIVQLYILCITMFFVFYYARISRIDSTNNIARRVQIIRFLQQIIVLYEGNHLKTVFEEIYGRGNEYNDRMMRLVKLAEREEDIIKYANSNKNKTALLEYYSHKEICFVGYMMTDNKIFFEGSNDNIFKYNTFCGVNPNKGIKVGTRKKEIEEKKIKKSGLVTIPAVLLLSAFIATAYTTFVAFMHFKSVNPNCIPN